MERLSVNGKLVPVDNSLTIKDQYTGHFLKINYNQEIAGSVIFGNDRADVAPNGDFRFYVPKKELIVDEIVNIEVYSPSGELLGKQAYTHSSLKASDVSVINNDTSALFKIKIDPKVIEFNDTSPTESATKKIKGKVIDTSGESNASNLQIIFMVSDDSSLEYDAEKFTPIFTAATDKYGYFYGDVVNKTIQKAYGVIAGNEHNPILIALEDGKLPSDVILVSDLSNMTIDTDCGCSSSLPELPDSEDLVNSSSFSQDLGGTCVDFTVPNRTLEEFSFYHTVRTTEPEIKGFTINARDSKNIKNDLFDVSDNVFNIFGRLNNSFSSLALTPYVLESTPEEQKKDGVTFHSSEGKENAQLLSSYSFPNYSLKMNIGDNSPFQIKTNDLLSAHRQLVPADIIKLATEQEKRKKKLKNLHNKLAAAYCGKKGVEPVKSFCEELVLQDSLNREELKSILGHLEKSRSKLELDEKTKKLYNQYLIEIEKLINKETVDEKALKSAISKTESLIIAIDKDTNESQAQEIVLGYLRRTIVLLSESKESKALDFEPCPIQDDDETMGIVCLMQKFKELKNTLQNTSIFSLGEILEIRAYYTIFLNSIKTFVNLLDEYYTFYKSSSDLTVELVDDYFYENYNDIKSNLISLRRQINISIRKIEEIKTAYILNHPGRVNLTVENSIDWDETPTIYENTTIAHGHILHIKQKWKADGYSLGDLLYSLPLAPCQEKQIAIVDWDRNEFGSRFETSVSADQLEAQISRDRDITEIMNSSFGESINASSTNTTKSTSGGFGAGVGGFLSGVLFGVAGGVSHSGASSSSTANQNTSRNLSANSLNSLRDNTSQSASSLRSQRSTVIQTVGQNESVNVQTEVIKNNNHCHAVTVEYFEVLKHYAIEQEIVDVQECLFVPMPMSYFDNKKVLRWKNTLRKSMYGRKLLRGFGAIERIESNYVNSDLPLGTYAEETIENFSGHFTISFELERPYIKEIDEATKTEEYDLSIPFPWFFGRMIFPLEVEVPLTEAEKDAIFEEQYAPDIVRGFIDTLSFYAISDSGVEQEIDLDVTLLSNYKKGTPLRVSINSATIPSITREQIKYLRVRANTNVLSTSKIILRSFYLNYNTPHLNEYIINKNRINNDIINSLEISLFTGIETVTDAALIYTPMNNREQRNPRKEDQDAAIELVDFLNEHLEMSHKIIWSSLDSSRLFGLLDGYIAPNSNGRSVASVVENKVKGIVGNNLVLKVIPGERLDPVFKNVENLFEYYKPTTKPDPYRVSVPTKGVYAESVMGKCNSCEEIDETRHWRFNDEPCGTSPAAIDTVSTASRRSEPADLQAKDFPSNIINMQNAPAAPDPTGLAAAYELLGKGDAFKDYTGLAGTQANALGALQTTSKSVTDLASISKDFANLAVMANQKEDGAKQIEQIKKLNKDGYLSNDEANQEIKKVLGSYSNAAESVAGKNDSPGSTSLTSVPEIQEAISKASNSGDGNISVSRETPLGSESVVIGDSVSNTPSIIENTDLNANTRSFSPATPASPGSGSKTGKTNFSVRVNDMPVGGSVRWSVPPSDAGDYTFTGGVTSTNGESVEILGIKPGLSNVDVEVLDASGSVKQSIKMPLSIPQFVTIDEGATEFDKALTNIGLDSFKNEIIDVAKVTCDSILVGTNVRTIWQMGNHNETLPSHITNDFVTKAIFKNEDTADKNLFGVTFNAAGAVGNIVPNRTIEIYPNAYDNPLPSGNLSDTYLDTETQALLIQIKDEDLSVNTALRDFAIDVYGRLLGETLAHEIVHALLWKIIDPSFHNKPAIANDLMNAGYDRTFTQRTGFVDNAMVSPVDPVNFTDNGIASVSRLQAVNQERMDANFPVPSTRATSFK